MRCPYCNAEIPEGRLYCDFCKKPLPDVGVNSDNEADERPAKLSTLRRWLIVLTALMTLLIIGLLIYKGSSWIDAYMVSRLYGKNGSYAPAITQVSMSDGRQGHAVVFFGEDGDAVYLPELDRSLPICGGVARFEIADADWFYDEAGQYDYADITFAPLLVKPDGEQIQLPTLNYQVDVPESPLTVTSPEEDGMNVVTSSYELTLKVVPGSSLYINGTDVTEKVDRAGDFSSRVSVRPIGDNTYTVIVRTPRHKETRRDITLYRQQYDIEIELDEQVSNRSSEDTMTIKGKCEPGAVIEVDTEYIEESLVMDMTTGEFSFIAKLEDLGENTIRFHASMPGRQDANLTINVYYKPTLARYAANAWAMDYDQLRRYYETWMNRVFKCTGAIVDTITDEGKQCFVMNLNPSGEPQYLILENDSTLTTPAMGPIYTAYADVSGRAFYQNNYYPKLIARYIDLDN